MVIKSIILVLGSPPAKTPLVAFDPDPAVPLASVKSPKSCALPRVVSVMYDILLIFEPVLPPAAITHESVICKLLLFVHLQHNLNHQNQLHFLLLQW